MLLAVVAKDCGKCVDFCVLTKTSNACISWEKQKNSEPELYEQFMETHNCPINHEGSAGSMEAAGLMECFMNSIENRKLRYTHYIGDGDSKAHNEVVKNDPYPGIVVEEECVDHIQKRLGICLHNFKHTMKGPLTDSKTLGLSFT